MQPQTHQGRSDAAASQLADIVSRQLALPVAPAFGAAATALRAEFGPSVCGILLYGSCLRTGDLSGLIDLYLLVDDYQAAYKNPLLRWANRLLPPNVFYREVPYEGNTLRCKCAVLSLADFEKYTRGRLQSYFWARFAQPTRLLYRRDASIERRITAASCQAVLTALREAAALLPGATDAHALWRTLLRASYAAELRPERSTGIENLVTVAAQYYTEVTRAAGATWGEPDGLVGDPSNDLVTPRGGWRRRAGRGKWLLRRWQGKLLNVLRILKASQTFAGGIDYLCWKIGRHAGIAIEVTPQMRRHPWRYGFPLLWRLYRAGSFR